MTSKVIDRNGTTIKLEITIDIGGSMLQAEDAILEALNEAGYVATQEAIQRFDPIFLS